MLYTPSGGLVTPSGAPAYVGPARNELMEERVNTELREHFDELLHVKWIPTAAYNDRHGVWEGRYALCSRWPQTDKRWAEVREGKYPMADAFDIIGWSCENMQTSASTPISPDLMMPRIAEHLGKMDNTRFPWKDRMKKTIEHNQKVREDQKKEAMDMVHDEASHQYYKTKGVRVFT